MTAPGRRARCASSGVLLGAAALACTRAPAGGQPGGPPAAEPHPTREEQSSGTDALLQAVSPVSTRVVWVSGHAGSYARTTDGGATWRAAVVPGVDTLQFRDVHAVDESTAYLLSAGPGDLSRIYKTTDAGRSWTLQFRNAEPKAFFDCMDFWDAEHGAAYSDAVDGQIVIVATADGGAHWTRVPPSALPPALPGEAGFAASGSCLVTRGRDHAWAGTGGPTGARVLRTEDRGRSWTAAATPVVSGEAAGITSLAFRDTLRGVALGGRIGGPAGPSDNVAVTADGGRTWTPGGRPRLSGAIYGGAYVPGAPVPTLVAVGPGGADYSLDDGRTWASLDTRSYWSVAFAAPSAGWAVGPHGRIVKLRFF